LLIYIKIKEYQEKEGSIYNVITQREQNLRVTTEFGQSALSAGGKCCHRQRCL